MNEKPFENLQSYIQAIAVGSRRMCSSCLSPTSIIRDIIDRQSLLDCIEYFEFMFILSYHRKVKVKTVPYCFQASSSWT